MKLLIDAGNTRIKWAWLPTTSARVMPDFQPSHCDTQAWLALDARTQQASALAQAVMQAEQVWVSNVAGVSFDQALRQCQTQASIHRMQSPAHYVGLHNHYLQPSQLGVDRWLCSLAVWRLLGQSALVVSAGTALTIDALQVDMTADTAHFLGGSIQPGLALMRQSLQQGAAQLAPAWSDHGTAESLFSASSCEVFPTQTSTAMMRGCQLAMLGAVQMQYRVLAHRLAHAPYLVLTGGDAAWMHHDLLHVTVNTIDKAVPHLPVVQAIAAEKITYIPELVLHGLAIVAQEMHK